MDGIAIVVGPARGAGDGAVGARWAGRWRIFRYEIRRGGTIADIAEAVDGPRRVDVDAARVLGLVPQVPRPVWGRDELRAGEMWNSNSVIAWLLARAGVDVAAIHPPAGGRAPGWDAGLVVAARDQLVSDQSARGSGSGVSRASICSRRSSRNGGRMILVPSSESSRPSTRKPGSSVASSYRTPPGSRK